MDSMDVTRMSFHCLLIGCVLGFSSACIICCKCGTFLPNDPYYYVNETSNFSCSLDKVTESENASVLYITRSGKEMDQSYITIINETTVAFNKPMGMEDNANFMCLRRGNYSTKDEIIGGQVVQVDYPLEAINEIDCVWHNWNVQLVCKWDLPYRHTLDIEVNIILYNGAYISCPNMVNKRQCTWTTGIDVPIVGFRLNVTNTNQHKSHSMTGNWITKNSSENVKPNPVQSFHQAFTNQSTCVFLTWEYDPNIGSFREKYFRIQYSPVTDLSQNQTVWSDGYNVTVCQLTPHSQYQFTIAVHPDRNAVKGYWSDSVSQQFTTDQDVPRAAPKMVGHRQPTEFCLDNHNINTTIYWKSIPEEDRNGVITSYRVKVHDMSPGGLATEITLYNTQHTDTNLKLGCNKLYNISIMAATIKGYSQHNSGLIINTTGFSPPVVMVERNTSLYNISWTLPEPANSLTNFTVVYCEQLGSQQDCFGELEKVDVSNVHHHTLSLKLETSYLFGVSEVRAGVNSAITFQSCVYVSTATPNPPEFSVDDSIKDDSVRVVWDPITCNNQQPYVRSFTIMWCPTDRKQENQCSGPQSKVLIPSTSKNEYIIRNLQKGVRYGVTMLSSSSAQTSRSSDMKYGTATNNDLSEGTIAGISIASLFILILFIAGAIFVCKLARKGCRICRKPYEIEIPDMKTEGQSPYSTDSEGSNNSETQLLSGKETKLEIDGQTNTTVIPKLVNRQISRDSGKGESEGTEPESPSRLDPVLEDEPSPYLKESEMLRPAGSSQTEGSYSKCDIVASDSPREEPVVMFVHRREISSRRDTTPDNFHINTDKRKTNDLDSNAVDSPYVTDTHLLSSNTTNKNLSAVPPNETSVGMYVSESQDYSKVCTSNTEQSQVNSDSPSIQTNTTGLSNSTNSTLETFYGNADVSELAVNPSTFQYVKTTNVASSATPTPTAPYVKTANVTSSANQTPNAPYNDATNEASSTNSTTPYVGSTNVANSKNSTTPYVDSTNVVSSTNSTTSYVDPANVASSTKSNTPYVGSTIVASSATSTPTTPYVDSTIVARSMTTISTTPYVDSTKVTSSTNSTTPYVDSTNMVSSTNSTTPYVESTKVASSANSTTPYVDSTNVASSTNSTIPYVNSTNVASSTNSTTPYVDSTNMSSSTTSTAPYVDTTNVATSINLNSIVPYVDSTIVANSMSPNSFSSNVDSTNMASLMTPNSTSPYVSSTNVASPSYVDSTNVVSSTNSTSPYVDSTNLTSSTNSSIPYVDSTNVSSSTNSSIPYVDSTNMAGSTNSTSAYVDSTNVTSSTNSASPSVDSTNVASSMNSTAPYVDSTNVASSATSPYVHSADPSHLNVLPEIPYRDALSQCLLKFDP
ncbi:serine-rich adhesin for platelets-like isoform X2 [Argopecten irradians]|uniref:serine-rich adhesin for platelets-like isoform X2 n=1 Tax=Argopecten irradians TaxID=31199 RepID=UPI0037185B8A